MNSLTPRQCEIMDLVNQQGEISIGELRQRLEISQATAYREIQELAQLGLINKISGGISRVEFSPLGCVNCGKENKQRTIFLVEKLNGVRQSACRARCGLLLIAGQTNISTAMTTDFFYGTLLNASQAWYVLNSTVNLCCSPSTLTFSNPHDAKRFTEGFGGELFNFSEVQRRINPAHASGRAPS